MKITRVERDLVQPEGCRTVDRALDLRPRGSALRHILRGIEQQMALGGYRPSPRGAGVHSPGQQRRKAAGRFVYSKRA